MLQSFWFKKKLKNKETKQKTKQIHAYFSCLIQNLKWSQECLFQAGALIMTLNFIRQQLHLGRKWIIEMGDGIFQRSKLNTKKNFWKVDLNMLEVQGFVEKEPQTPIVNLYSRSFCYSPKEIFKICFWEITSFLTGHKSRSTTSSSTFKDLFSSRLVVCWMLNTAKKKKKLIPKNLREIYVCFQNKS